MRHCTLLLVLGVACVSAHTTEDETATKSPVQKVITLLERLRKEIQKEGTQEAKDYDKFACFCKEQADDKLYAITKSKEKIQMLEAEIKELAAQIEELDAAIEKDENTKAEKIAEGKEKAGERETAREEYEEKEEGMSKALAAIKEAIEVLQENKGKLTDAKLLKVHAALRVIATSTTSTSTTTATISTTTTAHSVNGKPVLAHISKMVSNSTKQVSSAAKAFQFEEEKDRELIAAKKQIAELKAQLAKTQEKKYNSSESAATSAVKKVFALLSGEVTADPGKPTHKYEYKSSSIIETLQTLFAQFRDNKYELDNAETKEKQAYEMEKGARDMQIKFLGELIEKNTKLSAEKAEKKASLETDRDDEKDLVDKDQKFMDDLTNTCEEKAEGWDARSEKRSAEITAITKAIEALNSGAVENYDKTTVLMVKKSASNDLGFLQLSSKIKRHFGHKKHGARKAVTAFLTSRASVLKSKSLAMIAAQMSFAGDSFAKIRELIKDLIEKIKEQMEAEKEKKKFCDEELGKAVDRRDDMLAKTEEEANNIDGSKASIAKLTDDLTEVEQQIAELYKSLNEATELRNEEEADNAETLAAAKEGLAAVTQAIEVLKEFYGGFLQIQKKAPGGRDGQSVEDLAPEAETGEYKGKEDQGKGIIGLLEVIQGDYERTISDTEAAEDKSKSDFEDQESTIKDDTKALKKDSEDKTDELDTSKADLVEAEENLKDAKQRLADSKEELEKLRPQCVDLGLTFKARQARSEEEIKALEEALKILEKYAE